MGNDLSSRQTNQLATESPAVALQRLSCCEYQQLRSEWRRLFRSPPPKKMSAGMLRLGVAWKLQERLRGGHSRRVNGQLVRLATALSNGEDFSPGRTVSLKSGSRLVREWRGETHDVIVIDNGFRWRGEIWQSLSAIAREITGTRWSGPRFFGVASSGRRGALDKPSNAAQTGGTGDGETV